MKILEEVVEIEQGDSSKIASLLWDRNPIHYEPDSNGRIIYPGAGLMANAERMIRQTNTFTNPLNTGIFFKFSDPIYEGDIVRFLRTDRDVRIIKGKNEIGRFSLSDIKKVTGFGQLIQQNFELEVENLRQFYELVKEPSTEQVYFIFPVASIISLFIQNISEKVYFRRMNMNFIYCPEPGKLTTTIGLEKVEKMGRLMYRLYGKCEQEGKLICEGTGTAKIVQ